MRAAISTIRGVYGADLRQIEAANPPACSCEKSLETLYR